MDALTLPLSPTERRRRRDNPRMLRLRTPRDHECPTFVWVEGSKYGAYECVHHHVVWAHNFRHSAPDPVGGRG
jgi:hypothetical protein